MSKKRVLTCLVCVLCILLSGCSGAVPLSRSSAPTLLPVEQRFSAPAQDSTQQYAQTVFLCLPSAADGQLAMLPERILLPQDHHPGEATLSKLFSFRGDERARPLPGDVQLKLYPENGLEISGDIATVNLGADAQLLSSQDLYTVSRAIANTLTQWHDLRYVNILIAGQQAGIDAQRSIPLGSLQATRNEDAPALWDSLFARVKLEKPENQRFSSLCTLYFPSAMGRGILAEARTVSFPGQTRRQMVTSLLSALSAGSQTLPQLPVVPDLQALLSVPPEIHTAADGDIWVSLDFMAVANETFITAGIPRSIMLASLCQTLTTFVPGLLGVSVRIGNEQIEAIVPSGIYHGAGEQILFSGGILRRIDFSSFLLTDCTLYFANNSGGLIMVRRPVPYAFAYSRRYLLGQLMLGPQSFDGVQGAAPVFPESIVDKDLLGVAKEADTVLVNFSQSLVEACRGFSPDRERQLVYAMVNTLLQSSAVKRVRFYIQGEQPQSLAGSLFLPGDFLMNADIVQQ